MKTVRPAIERPTGLSRPYSWAFFCVGILLLKFLLFALDPSPKLYMGDSGSYIWTALSGWIPEDRSYLYGFVIRWTSVWTGSLTWLLYLQLFLSAVACILFAAIMRDSFRLPARWAQAGGFVCALDPLQLLYERYVMAEAVSLCLYAGVLYFAFRYVHRRQLRDLVAVQAISVLLIAFRMSFLLLVQIDTLLLPLLAFSGIVLSSFRGKLPKADSRGRALRTCGGHLLVSIAAMWALHTGYKELTGRLAHREAAYLHSTGISLLAAFSPLLEPADSPDPALADVIRHGDEFELKTFSLRNSQHYSPGRLIDRLSKLEPDPATANQLAKQTAMHALFRDPLGVAGLAWQTYAIYWNVGAMKSCATSDFSFDNPPGDGLVADLASRFHFVLNKHNRTQSFLQRYYVGAWPYYFLILVAPVFALLALVRRSGREDAVLLFIHISLMLAVTMLFGGESVRYFQPISYAMLLAIALLVRTGQSNRLGWASPNNLEN